MISISIRELLGARQFAAGATLGFSHFPAIVSTVKSASPSDADILVIFDFAGVEDVTSSYIKSTVLALQRCGRLHAGGLPAEELLESRVVIESLPAVVAVLNATEDIVECIHDAFGVNGQAVLCGAEIEGGRLAGAQLLGVIEPKAERTLDLIAPHAQVTATELLAMYPEEGISGATGWNNRLSELHRLRLLRRQTSGRQHTYYPIATEIKTHGKVLHRK